MWDLQAASFHAGVGLSNRVQSAHRGLGQNVNHLSFCSGLRADVSWFMKEWSNLEFSLRVHPVLLLLPVLVQFLIALGLFLTHTVTLEWGHDYLSVQIYIDWSNCPPSICCHPHLFLALLMNNLSNIKQWYLASRGTVCWVLNNNRERSSAVNNNNNDMVCDNCHNCDNCDNCDNSQGTVLWIIFRKHLIDNRAIAEAYCV